MRVTKTIKDYITREVNARIPVEDIPEYAAVMACREAAQEEFYTTIKEAHYRIMEDCNKRYKLPGAYCLCSDRPGNLNWQYGRDKLYYDNEAHRNEAEEKRKRAIEDIIITLELGGSKIELEEMLAKIDTEN